MRIIERAVMSDGTKIQLEDWTENPNQRRVSPYKLMIGAYPIAKETGMYGFLPKKGEVFRLSINANKYRQYTNQDVRKDYTALKNGKKTLEDLSAYFYNGKQDMYWLGMCKRWEVYEK